MRKWIMLTYGWKQPRRSLRRNAMKNHALQQRRGAGAVPLSPSWQVCSATWQLSISMINAVVPGLPVAKLKSVQLPHSKVKWKRAQCRKCSEGKQRTTKRKTLIYTFTHQRITVNMKTCQCKSLHLITGQSGLIMPWFQWVKALWLDRFGEWRTEQVCFGTFQNWFLR